MTDAARLEKIIERFKFIEPVPADIKKNLIISRNKILKSTLKDVKDYSLWFAIVLFVILKARNSGIKISFGFAKIITAGILIITSAAVVTGTYAVLHTFYIDSNNTVIEKKNSETESITAIEDAGLNGIEDNKAGNKQNEILPSYAIMLYNGKVYHGIIKYRGRNYIISTSQGIVNIPAKQIRLIKREKD